jgi:glycerol 2-dehydrogenase (NADP+)
MEAVLASGKVKAIGVSNFGVPLLQKLSKTWRTVPAVNQVRSRSCLWLLADAVDGQVELHPYNPSHELKKYCDSHGILLQAYCPLGSTGTSKPNSCDPALTDVSRLTLAERRGTAGDRRQAFRSNLHHPHLMVRQPGRHRPPQIGHTFT